MDALTLTPINALSPTVSPPPNQYVHGIVTLAWPYSASTQQCALLLADPDFRLRQRKGQIRVRFTGPSADALARARVGIGDAIDLRLEGARWGPDQEAARTPGRSVDGELIFGRRLGLRVLKDGGNVEDIEVDRIEDTTKDMKSSSPQSSDGQRLQQAVFATPLPKTRKIEALGQSPPGLYDSPAFLKSSALAGGSMFADSWYNSLMDEEIDVKRPAKRQRLSFEGLRWRYAGTAESRGPNKNEVESQDLPADGAHHVAPVPQQLSPVPAQPPAGDKCITSSEPPTGGFPSSSSVPSMAPPPLPKLTMPPPEPIFDQDHTPQDGGASAVEPKTPKLQPVASATLPLPSPFPIEPTHSTFETSLMSSLEAVPEVESHEALEASNPERDNLDHDIAKTSTGGHFPALEFVDFQDHALKQADSDVPEVNALAAQDDHVNGHDDSPGQIGDLTVDPGSDEDDTGDLTQDEDRQMGFVYDDEIEEVIEFSEHSIPSDDESDIDEEADTDSRHPVANSECETMSEQVANQQEPAQLPQTPSKTSGAEFAGGFGVDGPSSVRSSQQITPQSAKEKVMARTLSSLFGFSQTVDSEAGINASQEETGTSGEHNGLFDPQTESDEVSGHATKPSLPVIQSSFPAVEVIHVLESNAVDAPRTGEKLEPEPPSLDLVPASTQDIDVVKVDIGMSDRIHDSFGAAAAIVEESQARPEDDGLAEQRRTLSAEASQVQDSETIDIIEPGLRDTRDRSPTTTARPQNEGEVGDIDFVDLVKHRAELVNTSPSMLVPTQFQTQDPLPITGPPGDLIGSLDQEVAFDDIFTELGSVDFTSELLIPDPMPYSDISFIPESIDFQGSTSAPNQPTGGIVPEQHVVVEEEEEEEEEIAAVEEDVQHRGAIEEVIALDSSSLTAEEIGYDNKPIDDFNGPKQSSILAKISEHLDISQEPQEGQSEPEVESESKLEHVTTGNVPAQPKLPPASEHLSPSPMEASVQPSLPPSPSDPQSINIKNSQTTHIISGHGLPADQMPPTPQLTQQESPQQESSRGLSPNLQASTASPIEFARENDRTGKSPPVSFNAFVDVAQEEPLKVISVAGEEPIKLSRDDADRDTQQESIRDNETVSLKAAIEDAGNKPVAEHEIADADNEKHLSKEQYGEFSHMGEKDDGSTKEHEETSVVQRRAQPNRKPRNNRLSVVPDALREWFSPRRSSRHTLENKKSEDKQEVTQEVVTDTDTEEVDLEGMILRNGHILSTPGRTPALPVGFSTSLAYFTPLSALNQLVNSLSQHSSQASTVDIFGIALEATKDPVRAKGGPRDLFTTFQIADMSLDSENRVVVEVYRPWMASLPVAHVGDIVLLRSFVVKSRKRKSYLLSTDSSAWCVFRYEAAVEPTEEESDKPAWARKGRASGAAAAHVVREDIKGPPVEFGDEERLQAQRLRTWWMEQQKGEAT